MPPRNFGKLLLSVALVVGCRAGDSQGPASETPLPLLANGANGAEPSFEFTTIEVPGASFTVATGINARGDIVGTYVDANGRAHGYMLRGEGFTTIDYPGAAVTEARGIGPGGDIVGTYRLPGEPLVNVHGFLLTKHGEFVAVDYPGHINTIAQRILPDGTILGCLHDNDTMASMKGVVMRRGENEEMVAFASMTNGGTPDGKRRVGLYTNTALGRQEGFLIDRDVFTPIVVTGSVFTAAWDMNPAGEIVGVYRDAIGIHGFLRIGESDTTIDVPGATITRTFGINARGDIVGPYVAGGVTRGYVGRRVR